MATTNINEDEWLKFMEFIRRKYGNNSSDFIRINDYNNRSSRSVAEYYKRKYPTPTADININDNLEKLLKNASFIGLFNLNDPVEIPRFTEIYSETDSLMQKLRLNNSPQDDLYIKCNPTDDTEGNGFPNESTTNTTNTTSTSGSDLTSINPVISSDEIYNNVGFQVLISAFIIAVVIIIGLTFGSIKTALGNMGNPLNRKPNSSNLSLLQTHRMQIAAAAVKDAKNLSIGKSPIASKPSSVALWNKLREQSAKVPQQQSKAQVGIK